MGHCEEKNGSARFAILLLRYPINSKGGSGVQLDLDGCLLFLRLVTGGTTDCSGETTIVVINCVYTVRRDTRSVRR